jgi:hypothetical protein
VLQLQVRFGSEGDIGAGNVGGPTWNGMQIMAHPDCPNADLYMGLKKTLKVFASGKPFWQNKHTGGKILEWIQTEASYGAKLGYHMNFGVDRRNCWVRLGGLT